MARYVHSPASQLVGGSHKSARRDFSICCWSLALCLPPPRNNRGHLICTCVDEFVCVCPPTIRSLRLHRICLWHSVDNLAFNVASMLLWASLSFLQPSWESVKLPISPSVYIAVSTRIIQRLNLENSAGDYHDTSRKEFSIDFLSGWKDSLHNGAASTIDSERERSQKLFSQPPKGAKWVKNADVAALSSEQ